VIHPTAIIDPTAKISSDVKIGPYSIVGANVEIGDGCVIGSHVTIEGPTRLGKENKIYQFASIGSDPQDKKYAGEPTELIIGDRNVIRECCTISRGTTQDRNKTTIGNENWIMAYVHIAHDCDIGNHTIFANSATLAGHVTVQDYVILGGFTLVHQFCQLGAYCFTAMNSVISKDVPPFIMVSGHMAKPHGFNTEGLKRHKFSGETLATLKKVYKIVYRSGNTLDVALTKIEQQQFSDAAVDRFVTFLKSSSRGIVR